MGQLHYATLKTAITFDDRILAHLQLVIAAKLRRQESFFFSWNDPKEQGGIRGSVWLASSIPLHFTYESSKPQAINRQWLEELSATAHSAAGLQLTREPDQFVAAPAPVSAATPARSTRSGAGAGVTSPTVPPVGAEVPVERRRGMAVAGSRSR